jgi:hypothetical protein
LQADLDKNAPRGVVYDKARKKWAVKIAGKRYGRFANKFAAIAVFNMFSKLLQPSAPLYILPNDADFTHAEAISPEASTVLSSHVKVWCCVWYWLG